MSRRERDRIFATDADSPLPASRKATFGGLEYFEPDPAWHYAGWVERYASPERISMITTAGKPRPCERWGRVTFLREGTVLTLQVYRLLDLPEQAGGQGLFLPFKDATTGKDTYAAGRYVDLDGPEGGPFVLDFNRAYNPYCYYNPTFDCPYPPRSNRLQTPIRAGEKVK